MSSVNGKCVCSQHVQCIHKYYSYIMGIYKITKCIMVEVVKVSADTLVTMCYTVDGVPLQHSRHRQQVRCY